MTPEPSGDLLPSPRILMGPGPTMADPRVLRAMSTPLIGQFDPEFTRIMNEVMDLCRFVFQTENVGAFPVSGTGRAALEAAVLAYGGLDIVVSNAGIVHKAALLEHGEDVIDRIVHTNIKGNIFATQAAARVMMRQRSGRIILCSSIVAVVGEPLLSVYTASKGAILSYTRAAALEMAPYQVTVNCVLPGTTKTDMSRHVLEDPVVQKALVDPIPLGRLGAPEDLVGIVLYLASDESAWTTGQSFIVDGGHCAK